MKRLIEDLLQDWKRSLARNPIQGFDLAHQLSRLRYAKSISDGEAELIFRTLAECLHSYDQVTEVRPSTKRVRKTLTSLCQCSFCRGSLRTCTVSNLSASVSSTNKRSCVTSRWISSMSFVLIPYVNRPARPACWPLT